jgi:hypothetical protein
MTDIVETCLDFAIDCDRDDHCQAFLAAARRIEGLTEANQALDAEVERLRAALDGISHFGQRHPGHGFTCHRLAYAALNDETP